METIKNVELIPQFQRHMSIYGIETTRRRMVPDWRDGLKLSQRRTLYAMLECGCDKKFVKTSKIVGDTMGNYHPHGDVSIADVVKHLTNWFECYEPLIDNRSNFGSFQGDDAAAPRYTEAKLSQFSLDTMFAELIENKQVVDWAPTYNNENIEPEFLPNKVPNLLINGSFGIALGFVTGIPKHNLADVIDATVNLIRNPDAPVVLIPEQCMPCDIIEANWKTISNTGRGSFKIRARIDIEQVRDCYQLVIKSTPDFVNYDKGKGSGVKYKITDMVKNGKLPQITAIVEDSSKNDMRILIKLRKGSDPNYVRDMLYKNTALQTTFSVNFEVIDGIKLMRMSYKSYLQAFIMQRKMTKLRSYCIKLQNAKTKYHEKEAYIKLLESGEIDEIIQMIRSRNTIDDSELVEYLIKKLKITDIQAKFIINSNIKNLSKAYLNKYKEEYKKNKDIEARCMMMITDESKIEQEIINELLYFKQKYGHPRKCRVIKLSEAEGIPAGRFKIVITENNYIKKINPTDQVIAYKGDSPKHVLDIDNTDNIVLFSEQGRAFKLPVHKVPVSDKNSIGIDLRILIKGVMSSIVKVFPEDYIIKLSKTRKERYFLTVLTKGNCIKKMDLVDFVKVTPSGLLYTKLNNGDFVKDVQIVPAGADIIIYSGKKALRVGMDDIPHYKRSTYGVIAMKTNDIIDGFTVLHNTDAEPFIVVLTVLGKANKIVSSTLPRETRNKAGHNVIKLGKNDEIFAIHAANDSNTINIKTMNDTMDIQVCDIPISSSISTGIKLVSSKTAKNDVIIKSIIS